MADESSALPHEKVAINPHPSLRPRPFYVIGHNTNSRAEVEQALALGANAVEPDVNIYSDRTRPGLCISHDEGDDEAPSIDTFLNFLAETARRRPRLALVVLDCKTAAPEHGETVLNAVERYLVPESLNVIISVAWFGQVRLFDRISQRLGERQGLMIDEENSPDEVSAHFSKRKVKQYGFGNGISVAHGMLGPNVRPSTERACWLRAANGDPDKFPRFVYTWTVNEEPLLHEYIRVGLDGMITDEVSRLSAIVSHHDSVVRLATRQDNPFKPPNEAYALTVHTGDVHNAGTDADVIFGLRGTNGTQTLRLDTSFTRRMEQASRTYVTFPSPDLGTLQALTLLRDDSGNAPDWFVESVIVESRRYKAQARAHFGTWIGRRPVTRPLTSMP